MVIDEKSLEAKELKSTVPYVFYTNNYPFFRDYDKQYYKTTKFGEWTETRFFEYNQLQDCIANEFSDQQWGISMKSQAQLKNDILKAVDASNENYKIKLGMYYQFERNLPDEAKKAENTQYTTLDLRNYYDCHTA